VYADFYYSLKLHALSDGLFYKEAKRKEYSISVDHNVVRYLMSNFFNLSYFTGIFGDG